MHFYFLLTSPFEYILHCCFSLHIYLNLPLRHVYFLIFSSVIGVCIFFKNQAILLCFWLLWKIFGDFYSDEINTAGKSKQLSVLPELVLKNEVRFFEFSSAPKFFSSFYKTNALNLRFFWQLGEFPPKNPIFDWKSAQRPSIFHKIFHSIFISKLSFP